MTDQPDDIAQEQKFAALAKKLPGMLQQLHEKKVGAIAAQNGNVAKRLPCQVCGKVHYGSAFATKHKQCPRCRKALRSGLCAFVTIGDRGQHRYALAALAGMPADWEGTVRVVSDEEMDHLHGLINAP